MARVIWKGAISFGLVHIPVALHTGSRTSGTDFDWLDARSLEPVGYKRVNKVTGKEVPSEHIVKGVEYEKGRYVVLSEEEIRAARPEATQTIDILQFVERGEIPLPYFDAPYYLSPDRRGEKVYVLLRETLKKSDKVAVCQVVMHTRQRLAVLMQEEDALLLMTLRWPSEIRGVASLELNLGKVALDKRELQMAERLVADMTGAWDPEQYQDTFTEEIQRLVAQKAAKGELESVPSGEAQQDTGSADIIDLTELLKRSLRGGEAKPKSAAGKRTRSSDDKPRRRVARGK